MITYKKNTTAKNEINSNSIKKTDTEQHQRSRSRAFNVNFEEISDIVLL